MKYSKKQLTQQWLNEHPIQEWAACIHCGTALSNEDSSLVCSNNHRFDGAKQGYYFLSKTKLSSTKYDTALFDSRRRIIRETSLYDALHQQFESILNKENKDSQFIVDAGSGEGSHLLRMSQYLPISTRLVGIDLSKDGIQLATDYNGKMLSVIADLANLPIQNEVADVIFSILSPANYHEFDRVLKPQGLVIKVVPNMDYLIEIRNAMKAFDLIENTEYNNSNVIDVFNQHYLNVESIPVYQQVNMSLADKKALLNMTPLAWRLSETEREQLADDLSSKITLDCTILIGRKVN